MTLIVNAFGGPGAGKTTAAWDIAAQLKKEGLIVEYVSEYAKELVWDNNMELLDGSIKHQEIILQEQKRRLDRLIDKVDIIVTDAPILLNLLYCTEMQPSYEAQVLGDFQTYNNFNFIVKRGQTFEKVGRIHDLQQAIEKDKEILSFLDGHGIFYGSYTHANTTLLVQNIKKHYQYLKNQRAEERLASTPENYTKKKTVKVARR